VNSLGSCVVLGGFDRCCAVVSVHLTWVAVLHCMWLTVLWRYSTVSVFAWHLITVLCNCVHTWSVPRCFRFGKCTI